MIDDEFETCDCCHVEQSQFDITKHKGHRMCKDCADIAADMDYEEKRDRELEEC